MRWPLAVAFVILVAAVALPFLNTGNSVTGAFTGLAKGINFINVDLLSGVQEVDFALNEQFVITKGSIEHKARVVEINFDSVRLDYDDNPLILRFNRPISLDINNNGMNDLRVTYVAFTANRVTLAFERLEEIELMMPLPVEFEEEEEFFVPIEEAPPMPVVFREERAPFTPNIMLLAFILLVIFIIGFALGKMRKAKGPRHSHEKFAHSKGHRHKR